MKVQSYIILYEQFSGLTGHFEASGLRATMRNMGEKMPVFPPAISPSAAVSRTLCTLVEPYVYVSNIRQCTTTVETFNLWTLDESVLISEVSLFQGLRSTQTVYTWGGRKCPV